jgi:PhnB protein
VDLRFGDSRLAIGDEFPDLGIVSPLTLGGTYGALHLAVADAAAMWQKALEARAKVFEPLHEAFWGDYTGQFIDPFGHRWARLFGLVRVFPCTPGVRHTSRGSTVWRWSR